MYVQGDKPCDASPPLAVEVHSGGQPRASQAGGGAPDANQDSTLPVVLHHVVGQGLSLGLVRLYLSCAINYLGRLAECRWAALIHSSRRISVVATVVVVVVAVVVVVVVVVVDLN